MYCFLQYRYLIIASPPLGKGMLNQDNYYIMPILKTRHKPQKKGIYGQHYRINTPQCKELAGNA